MHAKYRNGLPQLKGTRLITDGGLETTLVFENGFDLPLFAAFTLVKTAKGAEALDAYMRKYGRIALRDGCGFLMDTPTWRASPRWAAQLGIGLKGLEEIHRHTVAQLAALRDEMETPASPFVINGVIGPYDDGYRPAELLSAEEAEAYHARQVGWFKASGADMVSAITMTYADEVIGIAQAAAEAGMPVVISFTVETDGKLPSGQPLGEAIMAVDAATAAAPDYYMINCAHPDHFTDALRAGDGWVGRIRGIRANASRLSHAELDEAEVLDSGNPHELGAQYRELMDILPRLVVFGGCCGTDHRHIGCISESCASVAA